MSHFSNVSIAGRSFEVISDDLYVAGMQGIFDGDELDLFESLINKDSVIDLSSARDIAISSLLVALAWNNLKVR